MHIQVSIILSRGGVLRVQDRSIHITAKVRGYIIVGHVWKHGETEKASSMTQNFDREVARDRHILLRARHNKK